LHVALLDFTGMSDVTGNVPKGVGGVAAAKMTLAQAHEALARHRAGEPQTKLAAEYGLSRTALGRWLAKAADDEARAAAPVDLGVQRTPREALQLILNDPHTKNEHLIQASRAMDALSNETLDGEDVARPASITLSGPAVCPDCGYDLTEERLTAVDSMIAGLAAESEKPADAGIGVPEDADTVTMPVDAGIAPLAQVVPIHGHPPITREQVADATGPPGVDAPDPGF
jgi:hypothetical protein